MKKLTAILLVLVLLFTTSATTLAAAGSSTVYFQLSNSQISVLVPVFATIVINADGDFTEVPSPSAYFIQNNSIFPVKVSSVSAASSGTWTNPWSFATTYTTGNDVIVATLTPGAAASINLLTTGVTPSGTAWNMAAADGATGGTDQINLALAGKIHGLTNTLSTDGAEAFKITFTVEAGAHS